MRILHGKSNLEVSSHGIALFVVGLILATFVGGAVRTVLRSDRVHQRIVEELKVRFPKMDIKIGATEVLLSRGIWPGLGLKLSSLQVRKETCDRLGFTLDIPQVVMSVSLWGLRKGEVRLGESEIAGGHLHLDSQPCPSPDVQSPGKSAGSTPSIVKKEFVWKPPQLDWRLWARLMNGVRVRDFVITYANEPTWKVNIRDAQAAFGHELSARAVVDVQKSLPFGEISHVIEFDSSSEDNVVDWRVHSDFKEGRIVWKGSWDVASHAAMSSLDVTQFPINEVLTELHQIGVLERDIEMRSTWISCSANWDGSLDRPSEMPVRVRSCKIEGTYGGAFVDVAEVFPFDPNPLKVPVELKVQSLQIQPLVEALNRKVLPAVINKLGIWSGQISYLNPRSWQLNGYLDNVEVVFSNKSVRGKQAFRRIHTTAQKIDELIAAKIESVDVPDGQFIGAIEFSLLEDWRSGTFKANVDNLILSPAIQTLLIDGAWESLKVHGSGALKDGELSDWRGIFEVSVLNGKGWRGDGLVVHSRYVPGVFTFESRLHGLVFDPDWRHFKLAQDRFVSEAKTIRFRDVKGKIDVRKNGGEITSLTGIEDVVGKMWRVRGAWSRDRDFSLFLNAFIGGKTRAFTIRSEKGLLAVDDQQSVAR